MFFAQKGVLMAIPVLQVGHWMTLCVSPKEKKIKSHFSST